MNNRNRLLLAGVLLGLSLAGTYYLVRPPVLNGTAKLEGLGRAITARPAWKSRSAALVFTDGDKSSTAVLAQRLATNGITAAVVNGTDVLQNFSSPSQPCLDAARLAGQIHHAVQALSLANNQPLFIAGAGKGALLPYLNALQKGASGTINVSSGFTAELPAGLMLCPPFAATEKGGKRFLADAPELKARWRSVWADKPAPETAIFIKEKVKTADTYIAEYNTPLSDLLAGELTAFGQEKNAPPMPVIEMPAAKPDQPITLFYSGDGGWRDLDRSVAEELRKLDYPVLGVDVLRYFWERKSPEQVTADLAATLRYYREKWGAKSFVLMGFSFGADLLPVVYNRLPEGDKQGVERIVLLALGNYADFEVHVAGWLGQATREIALAPELKKLPAAKLLCIYGKEEKEKTGTACASLADSAAKVIELPGGHHFDNDYPKLARLIVTHYPAKN